MAKKRNTKLALASLMAVSAITPVVASADTNGSVTTEAGTSRSTEAQVTKTIDFKVEDASGMAADYIQGPGILQERNGQQYIYLNNLSDDVFNMVTDVTVDGESALHEYGGKKMVLIPVSADSVSGKYKKSSGTGTGFPAFESSGKILCTGIGGKY